MCAQINHKIKNIAELASSEFNGLLRDLLSKYASRDEPAKDQLKKALRGFEIEIIEKVKGIYLQVSAQVESCDLSILKTQRSRIKTLLELESLPDNSDSQERTSLERTYRCYKETHEKLTIEKLQLNIALKKAHEILLSLRASVIEN